MESIFGKIKSSLSGLQLGGKTQGSVLGVDIGSSTIKVVQLRKDRGVVVLETYGEIALGPYAGLSVGQATNLPQDKLTEALRDVLREANTTTKDAGISIPFSSSLISVIEMPHVEKSQLATMVPIEARKYIPVSISEVELDWFVIPEDDAKFFSKAKGGSTESQPGKKKMQVLLVAIHKETLNKYYSVVKGVELTPSFFEIEIFSAIRSTVDRGIAPVVVLDIGAASTKLYIVEYGIVKSSHIINRGSQNISLALSQSTGISIEKAETLKRTLGLSGEGEASEAKNVSESAHIALDYIFGEAKRVILNYQKQYNKNIEAVILTGGGSKMHGIETVAQKAFEVDIRRADPFSRTQTPAFLEAVLKEAGPEFSVAVGLALRRLQESA